MLDPHRMSVFRAVVASGSVQAAADNLALTSSAVSQHLSALQRETGLVLFQRDGRGIAPTAAGRELAAESDEAMSQWGRLDAVVSDLREGRIGRLTIGYFASAGTAWMPALLKRLTDELPGLTVELVISEYTPRTQVPDIDVVFAGDPEHTRPGYRSVPLSTDPFVAVVHREHPLAGARAISLADLRAEPWVRADLPKSPGQRILADACAAAGFTPRYAVQAGEHFSALAFVAAGVGVTVIPRLAARGLDVGLVRLRLLDPTPVRYIFALVRDSGPRNLAAERVLEMLEELNAHPVRRGRA